MVAHLHFRPSEITLLLQPTGFVPDENTRVSDADIDMLSTLTGGAIQTQTARRGTGGERLPVITPDGNFLLQTLSLRGWRPDLPSGDSGASRELLGPRLIEVTDTVRTLNGLPQEQLSGDSNGRLLGEYTLLAASPNWLLYPMDD